VAINMSATLTNTFFMLNPPPHEMSHWPAQGPLINDTQVPPLRQGKITDPSSWFKTG
jgi:hypothetical protein